MTDFLNINFETLNKFETLKSLIDKEIVKIGKLKPKQKQSKNKNFITEVTKNQSPLQSQKQEVQNQDISVLVKSIESILNNVCFHVFVYLENIERNDKLRRPNLINEYLLKLMQEILGEVQLSTKDSRTQINFSFFITLKLKELLEILYVFTKADREERVNMALDEEQMNKLYKNTKQQILTDPKEKTDLTPSVATYLNNQTKRNVN